MIQDTNYYHLDKKREESIYDIWEQGGHHGDSVTPSTYSEAYRRMMVALIQRYVGERGVRIISLGCGNAAVEGDLVQRGYDVTGLDMNIEAVNYAKKKKVKAICGDFYTYEPEEKFDIVYADGFFGHLYNVQNNVSSVFERITEVILKRKGVIVVSNDAPRDTLAEVQKHPHVPDFHFLAPNYLARQAKSAGLQNIEVNTFYYARPISGVCPRAILTSELV